ncbi:MAG: cytochrome c oxidase accessory protein CcoG [Alphaproteobacteria bacterium]|jgi:cytochrome c oxidase accessory protein FixG|nr:cytochrome c oxidase accessory protein CcoG [Alphaproteobacteria bacterium]
MTEAITQTPVASEDVLSREQQKRQPLYAGRVEVYPRAVKGPIRRIKWAILGVLLALYYLAPWLRWDRGPDAPDQAFLIDMANRRAYFMWIEIWPQEVYYLAGLLLLGAFGLFMATSIAGRVWCGFTCPQTVWTDLYMWVERKIEGDRNARIKLDQQPWSGRKFRLRTTKHAVWLLIAFLTGGAWMMYYQDAPTLVSEFFVGQSSGTVYFFVGLFTFTTYLLAGWAREQVCTYMCPWPRFQSALLDDDSLVVTYQGWRGEPRGKHKRGESWEGRGHCIDDRLCVAVCPTGIDIRDGLQLECIGCGLCVDACNNVMDKVGLPRGLVKFDSEANQRAQARGEAPVHWTKRLIRPRTLIYIGIIALVAGIMLASLTTRATVDINVLHDRNPLFVRLSDGDIRNGFTIKILNMTREPRAYTLGLEGLENAAISVAGREDMAADGPIVLTAEADTIANYRVYVSVPRDTLASEAEPMAFLLTERDSGETARQESVFRGPER